MPSRPPTAGRRPDSEAGQSVASSVDTGAWVEFKAFPDPRHTACEQCDLEAVVELLDGDGAVYMKKKLGRERDVNALATVEGNKGGWTLIFYAAAGGQPDVIKYLIENGADLMHVDQYKQTCMAYAKGSQARQIIRGEQLKFAKRSESVAAIDEVHRRLNDVPSQSDHIKGLEAKRCRREDSLKTRLEAKIAGRKKTPDEDGSDEDRTDETQQILPGEVDPRDGPSPTQELEREVARLCVEEASSRESLVQSLADSRKRVQEAREAWEYHERLASAYRGRPPSEEDVEEATQVFFEFCIKPEVPPVWLDDDVGSTEVAVPRVGGLQADMDPLLGEMETVVEVEEVQEEAIQGFDSGQKQEVTDAAEALAVEAGGVSESLPRTTTSDTPEKRREIGIEGLLEAAKSLVGVDWEEETADRFLEKHVDDEDEMATTMTLEEFVDAFDSLRMTMRIYHLNILVDDALERQGALEIELAHDRMMQQAFDDALAATDRADKCYSLKSVPGGNEGRTTALPSGGVGVGTAPTNGRGASTVLTTRGAETSAPTRGREKSTSVPPSSGRSTSRTYVEDVRDAVSEMKDKVFHRGQFEDSLKKGKSALLDVVAMSTSFFKRPRAAKRLAVASEALAAAEDHLAHSCAPPQLGTTRIKMLLERRSRAGRHATGSTVISVFGAQAQFGQGQRSATADLLTLPEGDSETRGGTARTDTTNALLSDRTHAEVMDLVAEGQCLIDQLPEDMSGVIADAISRGGSPVAELVRRSGTRSQTSVSPGPDLGKMLSDRIHADVMNLVAEGQCLIDELPEDMSGVITDAISRGGSPVAEVMRHKGSGKSAAVVEFDKTDNGQEPTGHTEAAEIVTKDSSPHQGAGQTCPPQSETEIMEIKTHRASHSPDYKGPVHMAHLPGERTPLEAELDVEVVREMLVFCGIEQAADCDLDDLLDEVQAEHFIQMQRTGTETVLGIDAAGTLREHGPEAELIPMIYQKLQPMCWLHEVESDLKSAMKLKAQVMEQLKFYEKGKDAYEDATEDFAEGAYTDSKNKALDADRLFALSTTHDHKLLCREMATRSHKANIATLRDLAYENLYRAVELTDACQFDEARDAVEEAAAAYQKIADEDNTAEIEAALNQVNTTEERHFYGKLLSDCQIVFVEADRKMRARHYHDAIQEYQALVQPAEEFLQGFPSSTKGNHLIAYMHARRAMALSSHGNDMGEESGRKWHAQALEAARLSKSLFPEFPDAVLFEGIALLGMGKTHEACVVLETGLEEQDIRHGGGHERKMAMMLALARAKAEDENAAALVRTASRQSVVSRLASLSSNGDSDPVRKSLPTIPSAMWPQGNGVKNVSTDQSRHMESALPRII